MRPPVTGLWLRNVSNVIVALFDPSMTLIGSYDKSSPAELNPFVSVTLELDGLGLFMRGSYELNKRLLYPPFSLVVSISLYDEIEGLAPIAWAFIDSNQFKPDDLSSSIELRPLDDIYINEQYGGLPYEIPGFSTGTMNITPAQVYYKPEEAELDENGTVKKTPKTPTNAEVIEGIVKNYPAVVFGLDGERRMIIGNPSDGVHINIATAEVYDLQPNVHAINDYVTTLKWTGEDGWASYEYHRTDMGPLVPRVFRDMGAPETESVEVTSGPPCLYSSILQLEAQIKIPDEPTQNT